MTDDPRNDPHMVSIPFIFVKHGDPLPVEWIAEHPDYIKVPAVMVPNGTRPAPPWGDAASDARERGLTAEPCVSGSFAPPPAPPPLMRGGQPWPKDKNGRGWPKDRWGRPTRPLWDYPPGVRAPGEGVAPGAPDSTGEADAIGSARAALAALDPANVRAILASDRTGIGSGGMQTPPRGVASRYPGAYDVAEAGEGVVAPVGQRAPVSAQKPPAAPELQGKASFYNPERGSPTALPGGFDPDVHGAAMYGRPGFRLGDVVRVQLQDDPTRFVDVRVNDTGPFALDIQRQPLRPLRPNPDRVIDLTPAAMEALVGPNYAIIGLVRVTVTKLPTGSHEGQRESQ